MLSEERESFPKKRGDLVVYERIRILIKVSYFEEP